MSSCKPNFIFPGVTAKNSEVLSGTAASISCVVTGLTRQLDGVKWEKPDGTFIDSNSDGYTFEDGASNFGSNTQTTVLTIPSDINIVDAIYKCVLESNEHVLPSSKTNVQSKVFSKLSDYIIIFAISTVYFFLSDSAMVIGRQNIW